jgi:hypothetical protein
MRSRVVRSESVTPEATTRSSVAVGRRVSCSGRPLPE